MKWVPPELREDDGEIEAAINNTLPKNLIELKDIKGDLHLHSPESDGRSTIEELAEKALEKGYEYIIVNGEKIKIVPGNFKLIVPRGGLRGYESH